ncbi:MAG: RAD55 family ATPase [Thermoplasmata archaeon]
MSARIRTFVENYDEKLNGGIPKGHVVLLAGSPGTMKSSLAYSILYKNVILERRKGLYISLEQNRESLEDQMESLQMSREKAGDNLAILDLAAMRIKLEGLEGENLMNMLKMYALTIKRSFNYDLLVLDSADALRVLAEFEDFDMEYFKLFKWLKGLRITSFLISELPYPSSSSRNGHDFDFVGGEKKDFLADGILLLTMDQMGQFETQRRLRCVKMRGTAHETGHFVLGFDSGTFTATKAVA